MARIMCVANQKGGVGKTTTAINLASGLAMSRAPTLLMDLDPQCNATTGLGLRPVSDHPLFAAQPLNEALVQPDSDDLGDEVRLDIVPGSRSFADVDRLAGGEDQTERLRTHLEEVATSYEYIIVDCPPSLGPLTQAALAASTEVIMPIQCEYFAMEGLTQMIHVIRRIMHQPDRQLEFGGIVLTMFDHTLELTSEVEEEVRDFFGGIVFDTVIPRDVTVSEAPSYGRSVISHAPRSRGARAYIELCMEVLER